MITAFTAGFRMPPGKQRKKVAVRREPDGQGGFDDQVSLTVSSDSHKTLHTRNMLPRVSASSAVKVPDL